MYLNLCVAVQYGLCVAVQYGICVAIIWFFAIYSYTYAYLANGLGMAQDKGKVVGVEKKGDPGITRAGRD